MPDQREYSIGFPAEEFTLYTPGGFHPVNIKDQLKDKRYKIFNKLGQGAFATVWAAEDLQNDSNVCIKILTARVSENSHELLALQRINSDKGSEHAGRGYLPNLLDHFYHDGINGRHLCLVLELLGPSLWDLRKNSPGERLSISLARRVDRQLLLAVDYLHSLGLAHGDIHASNILCRVPTSHQSPPELRWVDKAQVFRKDTEPLEKGVPEYIVQPVVYSKEIYKDLVDIQLIDFSSSFTITDSPKDLITPEHLHPPEFIFGRSLSNAVDIWNIACLTVQIVTHSHPFNPVYTSRELIPRFHKIMGEASAHYLLTGLTEALETGVWKHFPTKHWRGSDNVILEEQVLVWFFDGYSDSADRDRIEHDLQIVARFLRKAFDVDPAKRATTKELLDEDWVRVKEDGDFLPDGSTHEVSQLES